MFLPNVYWCDELGSYVAVASEAALAAMTALVNEDGSEEEVEWELPEGCVELDFDEDVARRQLALMIHDGEMVNPPLEERNNLFSWGSREFLVVTDTEADDLWEEELENYLDDCVLCELPENVRFYFDKEKWKRDARIDGRAHAISRYDGNEDCVTVGEVDYYIYRQN